ncbi:MAG: ATP-binding protein [Ignavibacteria bacterium]|nr:ATP-binding protein [Ignavibacteria bacterium]MCC7159520.1 ATP-binding protein [Ignavibacteria bacterium]
MFERNQLKTLRNRIDEPVKFIQILSGTRQVGKTTLVEQLIDKISNPVHFVTADTVPSSETNWIQLQWEAARIKLIRANAGWGLLVIDEIQKINNWSASVKKEWDQDRRKKINLKVILLGSSAVLMSKGLSESLTGRFETVILPHWSFEEMQIAFGYNADEYIWFGGYPGASALKSDENRWKDYILNSIVESTISKDILMLSNVKKPALLKNLFELSCIYSGQILSYTKLLGQLNDRGNSTTLAHYQDLLEQIWFISGIQKFSGSKVSARNSIPKWLVYNNAFFSVYSGEASNTFKNNSELFGRLVESAIGGYILNECRINSITVNYWRESNLEVDFVLSKNRKIIAIEVKTGSVKVHRGLNEFSKKYKTFKSILISNETIPWYDFLKVDIKQLFE